MALRFRGAFFLVWVDAIAIVARTNGATMTIGSLIGHRKSIDWSRVVVVGANGAGKTWFATAVSARLGVPVIHKDALALRTGWQQRPRAEVQAALAAAVAADRWILEGGPSVLSVPVLARATLVIWLDVPAPLRAWRILCRSMRYFGRTRPEHPPGNRDWPGLRQFRFMWQVLTVGPLVEQAILASLEAASVPLVRVRRKPAISALIEAAGQRAKAL